MNKKGLFFNLLINIILSLLLLFTCFSVTYFINENNAKEDLFTYGNDIALKFNSTDDKDLIYNEYKEILHFRVTIIPLDSNEVVLEVNNIDANPYNEDRLEEMKDNLNSYYYKKSNTLKEDVLYYVASNSSYYIRVGLLRSNIIQASIYVLIFGSILVILLNFLYYLYLQKVYKKNIYLLQNEVNKLSNVINFNENNLDITNNKSSNNINNDVLTYNNDEFKVLSETIDNTRLLILDNIKDLKIEKERIRYIINNINEGLIVLNNDNNVIMINDFVLKLLNIDKEEILNKYYKYLMFPLKFEEYISSLSNVSNKDTTLSFEQVLSNNKIYEFNFIKTSSYLDQNSSIIIIVISDITKLKEMIKTKKEFFQNSSHELKSPLTSIIAYSEMIDNNLLTSKEELDNANKSILKNAKRMKELISNMLYLSSLENNSENYTILEYLNVNNVISKILEDNEYKIKEKNITLNLNLKDDVILYIDHNDLDTLLRNLIINAIQYDKNSGHIEIELNNDYFRIKDDGIGIKDSEKDEIFTRFKRSKEALQVNEEGTGLGLAIVKHVALKYHYKIEVNSKENEYSEFIVYFNEVK